jgi:hypothetical protein
VVVGLASIGVSVAVAQISLQANEPAAIIGAYEAARNRGDLDTAMSYFADDATVTQRTATFNGKEEIRRYLQAAIGRGRFVVSSNRRSTGSQLNWVERPAGQNINGVEVSVEAIVKDGKIAALSYNGSISAARLEPALDGRAQLPALLGLASVVMVLSGVVLVASSGLGRPQLAQSSLRGHLLQDLQVWRSARGASG